MPAWIWITALAAVAFVGWVALGRGWFRAVLYSWRHAAHVIDLTQTEAIPGPEYIGSMGLADDPHAETIVAKVERYGDISGPPGGLTWDELMRAELSPEALDPLPAPPPDPGPGGALVSSSPPPGPDHLTDEVATLLRGMPSLADQWADLPRMGRKQGLAPSRLADTGEICAIRADHPLPADWLEAQLADLFAWVRWMHEVTV